MLHGSSGTVPHGIQSSSWCSWRRSYWGGGLRGSVRRGARPRFVGIATICGGTFPLSPEHNGAALLAVWDWHAQAKCNVQCHLGVPEPAREETRPLWTADGKRGADSPERLVMEAQRSATSDGSLRVEEAL